MKLIAAIFCLFFIPAIGFAATEAGGDDYLSYSIPNDAAKFGPIGAADPELVFYDYYPAGTTLASREGRNLIANGSICTFLDRWAWIDDPTHGIWQSWLSLGRSGRDYWVALPLQERSQHFSLFYKYS